MYIAINEPMGKTRKEEYAEATRTALLDSAQTLFAQDGYHHTSVDEICRRARVTKGALYHHYRNKEELFADVVESLELDLVERIGAALKDTDDPWAAGLYGVDLFLDHCLDPGYRRIVMIDAPNVLGAPTLAKIGERTAAGLLRTLFQNLMKAKLIAKQPLDVTVRLFSSVLIEGGLLIGESASPTKTKKDVRRMLVRFLEALR